MHITTLWKRSLKLCTPASLKIFFLLTLKAVRDIFKIPTILWSLVIIGILALFVDKFSTVIDHLFSILFIMAARPSMDIKDWTYFRRNIKRSIVMIAVYAVVTIIISFILFGFAGITAVILKNWYAQYGQAIFIIPIIIIFSIIFTLMSIPVQYFALLFYLDRKESAWLAYKRALAMFWYNIPGLFVYFMVYNTITIAIGALVAFLFSVMWNIPFIIMIFNTYINVLFTIIFVCLITNLYIKLVHDQYELYFPGDVYNE